jgi:glycosyltransferase involved in cell wall biosynthesis
MARRFRRVIQVCPTGMTAKKLLLPQCRYLQAKGYDVSFVFSPGPEAQDLRDLGFGVKELAITRGRMTPKDMVSILRLAKHLASLELDVVHTHTDKGGGVGRIAARLADVPCVIHTVHGFAFGEDQSPAKYRMYSMMERQLSRYTDVLLSQSSEDVETAKRLKIRAKAGYPIWIGNGVDVELFDKSRFTIREQSELRAMLHAGSEPVITRVARLTFQKGYRELIEALAACVDLPWVALFVGRDDNDGPAIRQLLVECGITHRVRLLGDRDDIPLLLAVSDLFVLPSYTEGVPRSVIEAQSMGLPAVVTDVRGCREVVVHQQTGLIVKPKDPLGLANALRMMLQDPVLRSKCGDNGCSRARQLFSEHLVFERIASAYEIGEQIAG